MEREGRYGQDMMQGVMHKMR